MKPKPSPIFQNPMSGLQVEVAGDRYRFLALKQDTNGQYTMWEALVPQGGGPPPHSHSHEDEGIYVIVGRLTVWVNDQKQILTAGSFVYLPKGTVHYFRNESTSEVRLLLFVTPGGLEEFFTRVGHSISGEHSPVRSMTKEDRERIEAVAPEYGIRIHSAKDSEVG